MASPFRWALMLSAMVLAGAFLLGLSLARPAAPAPAPAGTTAVAGPATPGFWSGAAFVFSRNIMVAGALLLGACTFGLLTLATVAWNGYQLGFGLGALHMASPERAMWVLLYVPIEFGALLVAASAALELSRQLWLSLLCGHEFRPRVWGALALAAGMFAMAAILEAVAARAIARL